MTWCSSETWSGSETASRDAMRTNLTVAGLGHHGFDGDTPR
ncbi:hypothetical protein ABTY98_00065 [Streptomyces sp. NPDC096040]